MMKRGALPHVIAAIGTELNAAGARNDERQAELLGAHGHVLVRAWSSGPG